VKVAALAGILAAAILAAVAYSYRRIYNKPYFDEFLLASIESGVPVKRVIAIATQESGIQMVDGQAGEKGIMQLTSPAVIDAERHTGKTFPGWQTDPRQNIRAGVGYLSYLFKVEFPRDLDTATRAYNAGPTGAREGGGYSYLAAVKSVQSTF
jgi:soluble lytic murein transglycosylase-like protein